ncbi:MAG TPA: prepilin-type N-terminal cleavage/methylation domain-containing protein [Pirellulales bacterium]|nr:prepilin-type N-terminal cleavage/methylation domain-containing protein [Pirellulales bacterium]
MIQTPHRFPSQSAQARSGFTLVEVLVVLVILAILAALITAAAANALWAAKQYKIKNEVDMLAGAMEAFKQKYNSYPPADLTCPNDANMVPAANSLLLAFVTRAFPRYAIASSTNAYTVSSIAEQIGYDLYYGSGGVQIPSGAAGYQYTINPQIALAFWLSGFTSDPTDPFNRTGNPTLTRTAFYTFNPTQLIDVATGATAMPTTPAIFGTPVGRMVYNAPYGNAAYCYFDYQSYGQLMWADGGSPPNWYVGYSAPQAAVGSSPGYGGIAFASTTATTSQNPVWLSGSRYTWLQLFNGTGYVMPYVFDTNNLGILGYNQGVQDTFCKPTSFQIISAGQDGCFGTLGSASGLTVNSPYNGRLYPTGYNYDLPPTAGGSGDDDNVTNFCEKSTLDAARP